MGYIRRWMHTRVAKKISHYYQEVFGRPPDAPGLKHWEQQVQSGKMTLSEVRRELEQSQEARFRWYY